MGEAIAAQAAQDFYFNPWDENFRANPYPHYRPLLAGPPRIIDLGFKFALAARYADVRAILTDHATFSSVQPKGMGLTSSRRHLATRRRCSAPILRRKHGCGGWSRATSRRDESASWNRASAKSQKI